MNFFNNKYLELLFEETIKRIYGAEKALSAPWDHRVRWKWVYYYFLVIHVVLSYDIYANVFIDK
jgi:hypothetical protein